MNKKCIGMEGPFSKLREKQLHNLMSLKEQTKMLNKWEQLFESFLDVIEFSLIHYENGKMSENDESVMGHWGLQDRQGANLGGIEGDIFDNVKDIIERLSVYINDYFYEDLEEEAENYEICLPSDELLEVKYGKEIHWRGTVYWLAIRQELGENHEFVKDHNFEFEVLDMIANHFNEINLNKVYHEEA